MSQNGTWTEGLIGKGLPLRAYLDASVPGGYYDAGFDVATREFVAAILDGKITPVVSDTLISEISRAPERVRDVLTSISGAGLERVTATNDALDLRDAYLRAGVVTEASADDAMHVAQATIARADVIVSWNFRHMVNPWRVRMFNGVNVSRGYGVVVILTPADVVRFLKESENESL